METTRVLPLTLPSINGSGCHCVSPDSLAHSKQHAWLAERLSYVTSSAAGLSQSIARFRLPDYCGKCPLVCTR